MPFRTQYIALAAPAWPPNMVRMRKIYNTIARTIKNPTPAQKAGLLTLIQNELVAFDTNYTIHLATQVDFNNWHGAAIGRITALPFTWTDKNGVVHPTLSFGAAQKFLNLGLKDWWALSPNGINPVTPVDRLHGPLDQIVYSCTSRFCASLPSMHNPKGFLQSYVYYLTPADYLIYQQHLVMLSSRLVAGLTIPPPRRIELEQLLWGWI